ncbi:hypothetical protein D3C72_2185820 [compost metagenome]
MADGDRAQRKIIPFPGRRVDDTPAFPLRLMAMVVAALMAGQALQVLLAPRHAEPAALPDAIDLPMPPAMPGR